MNRVPMTTQAKKTTTAATGDGEAPGANQHPDASPGPGTSGSGDGPSSLTSPSSRRGPSWKRLAGAGLRGSGYPLLILIVCIGIWQAIVSFTSIKGYLLPSPQHVAQAIGSNIHPLLSATEVTSKESVYGFLVATAVGIPIGILVALTKVGSRGIYPLVVGSNAIPKVAIAPLFVIWFGFGELPKVLIAFLVAFFPIVVNTVIGVVGIEKEKLYLAESMGMGGFSTLWRIRLPQALPSIFAGLKIATSLAVIGAVVGEFVDANSGLGMVILKAGGNLQTSLVFASLVFLTLIGIVFFAVIVAVEQLLLPWQRVVTQREL